MHASAIRFALRYNFRLARSGSGYYYLVAADGTRIDTPATGGNTAAGAIRMMLRHVRLGRIDARAG